MVGDTNLSYSVGVGDLVEYTHPHARDIGIVVGITTIGISGRREASVMWSIEQFTERLSVGNEHLKLIQKRSRKE